MKQQQDAKDPYTTGIVIGQRRILIDEHFHNQKIPIDFKNFELSLLQPGEQEMNATGLIEDETEKKTNCRILGDGLSWNDALLLLYVLTTCDILQ